MLTVVCCSTVVAIGQTLVSQIEGTVWGTDKAVVSQASISVTRNGSTNTTSARSGTDGKYLLAKLSPGTYNLMASADGFQPFKQQVFVTAGASVRVNIHLTAEERRR